MNTIILKHLTQVLLIPAAVITIGWYGYIATAIQPDWKASTWIVVGIITIVVAEIVATKIEERIILAAFALTACATIVGVPIYLFVEPFPVKVWGVMDHGGAILALAVIALASFPWRIRREIGVVEVSAESNAGEHSTDTINKRLQRDEEAIAHSAGFPGMSWGAALRRQDQERQEDDVRHRANNCDDY